jgi:signal transduction histidine kinase
VNSTVKVLLVEDSPTDAGLLEESLNNGANGRFDITRVERLADGLERLRDTKFDVVLLDLSLPDSTGRETFMRARVHAPEVPIIVMTGDLDEAVALDALREGVQDYLIKGQAFGRQTSRAIRYAIERKRLELALQSERDKLEARVHERTAELTAANHSMQSEIARRQQAEEAQKQVLRRLQGLEETERGRISRELHDRLGQDLTALKLGLRWLRKQCPLLSDATARQLEEPKQEPRRSSAPEPPARLEAEAGAPTADRQLLRENCPFAPEVHEGITKLEQLTDGLMRDIHRLAWELHPAVLDDLGLEPALERYGAEWSADTGVKVDFHSDGKPSGRLALELEAALYRVAQEALTNVFRHAKARRVSVLLAHRADQVSLIIEDDGVGFDTEAVFHAGGVQDKLGLLGMQERIRQAGGIIEIESTRNRGTTVFARIPLPVGIPGRT